MTKPNRPRLAVAPMLCALFAGLPAAAPPALAHSPGNATATAPHVIHGGENQPSDAIAEVEEVHVVVMTHLDVGFTDFALSVIDRYFHTFYPAAIAYAQQIAANPALADFGYVFTTQPWLLSLFLDCPQNLLPELQCPTDNEKAAVVEAIEGGVISWQGNAFNLQSSLMDPSLYGWSLDMAHRLDDRFGKPRKTTVSLRDVPGTSRAALPLLRERGYSGFSVGVNPSVVSAAVGGAFVWDDGSGSDGVLTLIHPGGYGGVKLPDCVTAPALGKALCVWVTGDNSGPPDPLAVFQVRRIIAQQYPNAQRIFASDFDAFMAELATVRGELPVVDQEIGDSWISGPPSDPWKIAAFRLMSRARAECVGSGRCNPDEPAIADFSRLLLKAPEHTAGLSSTGRLAAYDKDWSNRRFAAVRESAEFRTVEASWDEQRGFLTLALEALDAEGASAAARELGERIAAELPALRPAAPPSTEGWSEVPPGGPYRCGSLEIGFDAEEGAISHLVDLRNGRRWASAVAARRDPPATRHADRYRLDRALRQEGANLPERLAVEDRLLLEGEVELAADEYPLALFLYRTYDPLDFWLYVRQYMGAWPPATSTVEFEKPGVESALPRSRVWLPKLDRVWREGSAEPADGGGCRFLLETSLPILAHKRYGAPRKLWVGVEVPKEEARVDVDLAWFDKTATRLPESLWVAFRPYRAGDDGWSLDVLGQRIDPRRVVVNGSRHLAAVWGGVGYRDDAGSFHVESLDAGVVSPGLPALVDYNNHPVAPSEGIFFNLANNVWNTNWPLWYPWHDEDGNARFRFTLRFGDGTDGAAR